MRKFVAIVLLWIAFPTISFAIELEVKIEGVRSKLLASVKGDLLLYKAVKEPKLTSERISHLYYLADDQIQGSLQAHGYYNSTIQKSLDKITNPKRWLATFVITPGEPTIVTSLSVRVEGPGEFDPAVKKALVTPELKTGKVLDHKSYESTKEHLLSDITALGYLQATFSTNIIEIDKDLRTAKIIFVVDTV